MIFNNDGSPDLFLVNESGSSISVLINKNDGTGTFLTSVNYAVGNNPLDGYSVDINNDGYKDIVTSNSNGLSPIRGLSTFINNGDGTFANPINHSLNYIPFRLASADLNNDGNADLAIIGTETTNYSRVLSIMLGNGDGTYTAHTDEVPNYSPTDIKIADLNNDGIADLAVKAYDALYLHFNDGSASFTPEEFSVSFYSEELAAADLNNDNQIDFAYAHLQSGNIEVLTNSTGVVPTVFTEQTPIAVNSLFIISDADGNSDWNGGTLAFQITQNAESSDNLSLPNSNPGNDGIWLDGVQLKAGSTVIGTASAASVSNGSAWTFTFNGNATNALVQATARAVIFDNSSDAPGANNRIITVTATDKNGAISTLAQPIEITLVNDAPVISNLNTDSVAWAGVGNSVLLDASTAVTISDVENGASDWNNCVLKVQRYVGSVATPLGTDIFSFDGDSGFTVNGSNLEDNSTAFASFTNSNGELAITFNSNATTTLIQSVMGAINYRNDKPTGDTLIRFTLTDQDNGATTADVTVTSDTIYVTNASDNSRINVSDGISLSEAIAIAAADTTDSQTLVFDSSLAGQVITLSGAVTLGEGLTLDASEANNVVVTGSSLDLADGTTLAVKTGTNNFTLGSDLTGAGGVSKVGSGSLELSGNNTFSGGTTVNAGYLQISADANLGSGGLTLNGGGVSINASITVDNAITLNQNAIISHNNTDTTLSGIISGAGHWMKLGSGTLTLSGDNTYSGSVTIINGTLAIASDANLGTGNLIFSGGHLSITAATTIDNAMAFNQNATVSNSAAVVVSGVISGANLFTKEGAGALTLSGANTHTGSINVNAGTLALANGSALGNSSGVTVASGAHLQLHADETVGAISGAGDIELGSSTLTSNSSINTSVSGVISGSGALVKEGSGTLTLSGTNTFSGDTTLNAGTLAVSGGSALDDDSSVTVGNNSTLEITDSETLGALSGSGSVHIGSGEVLSVGANDSSTTFSGVISDTASGSLEKVGSGTLTLSGTSTYDGSTTVGDGTLLVDGALSNTSGVTVASGATLGGVGSVNGVTVNNGGTLIAATDGTSGSLTVNGDVLINNGGILKVDIGGSSADQIAVVGAVDISGAVLTLNAITGTPALDDVITLIDNDASDAITGTLQGKAEGSVFVWNGLELQISYSGGTGNDLTLTVVDRTAPTAVDADISVTGASGNHNEFIIGDVVTAVYDPTTNTDIDTVTVDFSAFGGGVAVAANLQNSGPYAGKYVATYTVLSGSVNGNTANVSVTVTDFASNDTTAADTTNSTLDNSAPSLAIDAPFTIDNVINALEDNSVIVSGTSNDAIGSGVAISISDGINAPVTGSATVQNDGTWSATLDISGLTSGNVTVTANVDDGAGNAATPAVHTFTLDNIAPTLTLDAIATDNRINGTEDDSSVSISGSTSAEDGQTVTVNAGGVNKTATVSGGVWSVNLTSAEVQGWTEGSISISADVSDAAGNAATQATRSVSYDRSAPTLTINTVASDNRINGTEDDSNLTISGSTSAEDGQTVTVNAGGVNKTATVSGGVWSVNLTSAEVQGWTEGSVSISANVSDAAGNAATQATRSVSYDRTAPTATNVQRADLNNPAGSFTIAVQYSEAVSGVDSNDISLTGPSGALTVSAASYDANARTATYTIAAPNGGWSGSHSGSYQLAINSAQLFDNAGNSVAANSNTHNFTISIATNSAPQITSNGGGATAALSVTEGQTTVTTVMASDAEQNALTFSITGGADAARFTLGANGVLTFAAAPDFNNPLDAGADNSYAVEVTVSDGQGGSDVQALTVNVLSDLDGDGLADNTDNDIDNDGLLNSAEDPVPGAIGGLGDGNGDGIADRLQANVVSIPTVGSGTTAQKWGTLAVADGLTLSNVSNSAAAGIPRNAQMPVGQFDFTVNGVAVGGTITIDLYVDSALKTNGYFKKVGTAWYNIGTSTVVGTKTKLSFSITDGGIYDADGVANGVIKDPGGAVILTPLITSNGGEMTAEVSADENQTAVTTVVSELPPNSEGLTYQITGGADQALFVIDASTGELRFAETPDFETALDHDGNNQYEVEVAVDDGNGGSDTQAITVVVNNRNDAPDGVVVIAGRLAQGETLTATHTLSDADGLGDITYQWFADGVAIDGATGDSFTLTQAQVGQAMSVVASYTDGQGTAESVSSAASSAVANANDVPEGRVLITGNALQNQTLKATHTLSDADGLGDITYQWFADGVAIEGATASRFTLTAEQVGRVITVQASYTDGFGALENVTSNATATVLELGKIPDLPSVDEWTELPDDDHDGIPELIEALVPSLEVTNGTNGDGNGDGVADTEQADVASIPFRNTEHITQNPNASVVFVTLVGASNEGAATTNSSATITAAAQMDAPEDKPDNVDMPLGLISFTATTAVGANESFSLFVDGDVAVNGYWKQNAQGTWVNLASAEYGGQVVYTNGKTRLDFFLQDGGEFDEDGQVNGVIVDPGAPGWRAASNLVAGSPRREGLASGEGNDLMLGLQGRDVMYASNGDDWLAGEGGRDWYVWNSELGSGDLIAGGIDHIVDDQGILKFIPNTLGGLTLNGQTLNSYSSGVLTVGGQINASNRIAVVDGTVQIDLNADGSFNAADDFQIELYGNALGLSFDAHRQVFNLVNVGTSRSPSLTGSNAVDMLLGGREHDSLDGGVSDDQLYGARGRDTLVGGEGDDALIGGAARDWYVWNNALGEGDLAAGGHDLLIDRRGVLQFATTTLANLKIDGLNLGEHQGRSLTVGSQIDANNSIAVVGGAVQLDVNGDGSFSAADDFQITLYQATGLRFNAKTDLFKLTGTVPQQDVLDLDDANTRLGTRSTDTVTGDDADNRIYGLAGTDTLEGGLGRDVLIGGNARDQYVWASSALTAGGQDVLIDTRNSRVQLDTEQLANLHINGVTLDELVRRTKLASSIDSENSVAFTNGQLQVDINRDGNFNSTEDFSIQLVGNITRISYDAKHDLFVLS